MHCERCGRTEEIEEHHIVELCHGGTDEPRNKEYRCHACHKYEHARRVILTAIYYEKKIAPKLTSTIAKASVAERTRYLQRRLEVLDKLNTPGIIRISGKYNSYWCDNSLHELPRKKYSREEAELNRQMAEQLSLLVDDVLAEEMSNVE